MATKEDITKLVDEWMTLIGSDHHKDRDCHFMIELRWSYGNPPYYEVDHYGYRADEFHVRCDSLQMAQDILATRLQQMITKEKEWQLENGT